MVTLDQKGMHELEARCSQDSPPRCQVLCPFNVDARGVLKQLGAGNLREARRLLPRSTSDRHLRQHQHRSRRCSSSLIRTTIPTTCPSDETHAS